VVIVIIPGLMNYGQAVQKYMNEYLEQLAIQAADKIVLASPAPGIYSNGVYGNVTDEIEKVLKKAYEMGKHDGEAESIVKRIRATPGFRLN